MKDLLFNAKYVLSTTRYPWIDYVRGISIILVCYRHIFEGLADVGIGSNAYPALKYINIFFFSFRMPLFFIVSGLFVGLSLSKKGIREYITKRFSTIFHPLLIWGSLHITLQLVFAGIVHAQREPVDYLNLVIHPRKIEQFWYLNALFFVGVLYAFIKLKFAVRPWIQVILGVLFFYSSVLLKNNNIETGFLFDVLFFYMFFAIGDLISDFILNAKNYRWLASGYTILGILPFFLFIQHQFTMINLAHKDDYYVQYQVPALYVLAAITGGAFIVNLSFILERLNILRMLRVIGFHSLYIYVMHLMITAFTRIFFVRVLHIDNVPIIMIVALVLGIAVPMMVFNIINRSGGWWMFTLRYKDRVPLKQKPGFDIKYGLVTPKESER